MDPNPLDIAYWGYAPPLAIEDSFFGGVNTYYATYGTFSPGTEFAPGEVLNTFTGEVNLTDQTGFVAGLPFECTGICTNAVFRPDIGVSEFDWMDSRLGYSTSDNSTITGTATLTVGNLQSSDPISGSAQLTVNPTPTPEPSSLLLLGAGIVTIIIFVSKTVGHRTDNRENVAGSSTCPRILSGSFSVSSPAFAECGAESYRAKQKRI